MEVISFLESVQKGMKDNIYKFCKDGRCSQCGNCCSNLLPMKMCIRDRFISDMAPYVPYLIHGDNIGGVPVDGTPNDVTIEVIVLNKLTNAYRIVLYNNKGTDIHTICRIDGGWKSWVQIA